MVFEKTHSKDVTITRNVLLEIIFREKNTELSKHVWELKEKGMNYFDN